MSASLAIRRFIKQHFPKPVVLWLQHLDIAQRHFRRFSIPAFRDGYRAPLPKSIRIEPASACNLRCSHCPTGWKGNVGDPNRDIMKPDLFERVLSEVKKTATLKGAVFYFAGEPLLNRWLPDMLKRIKAETSVVHTSFSTNGMLLNDKAVDTIEDTGVDLIHVSIDGNTPDENDQIRVRSNYTRVKDNLLAARERLKDKGTKIRIHNVQIPTPDEIGTKPKAPQFLIDDFGADSVDVLHSSRWPGLHDAFLKERKLRLHKKRDVGTKTGEYFCTMPFDEMVIQSNGDVTVCCYDITGELKMGNIKDNTLEEIWNGPEYRKLRKAIASFGRLEKLPETCLKCHIYSSELVVR